MKKSGFKSLLKKIRPYAVPGIITGLVMIVILILKGIWPFGSSRIDYFDAAGSTALCTSVGFHAW